MCLHVLLREQGCRGGIVRIERLESPLARFRESTETDRLDSWNPPLCSDLLCADRVLATLRARSQISESRQKVSVCLRRDVDEIGDLVPGHGLWGLLLADSSAGEASPSSPAH
ncbi:hypothetical protein AGOR_G00018250 [Albula goreensis]|uniref:Uncharacterized protein n=1 Tax=Albula goreensis TaxID=1534307 RepID=A0A8T3E1V7_9TELE|nr:hypothetical protein AGOR_G00018250 [Albula goreensis]